MRRSFQALAVAVVASVAATAGAVCGDANGDGRVGVSDGVQTLRAAADLGSQCDDQCDFDGSGAITVSDGVNVLRKAADLPVVERCPEKNDPVSSLIGHTLDIFGPLVKVRAIGGPAPAGSSSPCDNASGGFQQTSDGFTFDDCDIGNVTLTGFLGAGDGSLSFNNLAVARRGDVLTLVGSLSVGDAGGNPELSGVLNGNSLQLGSYVITYQQVVTGPQGGTLDGQLVFDTSESDIPNVDEVQVTLTGGRSLPVVERFANGSTKNFSYDTTDDVLTPVDTPTPTPTATPPAARVRISNIDDRITTFLNGTQVLQAMSGPSGTTDTGFVEVDGLVCGDNVFEFRVENTVPNSGYTYRVQLEVGGAISIDRSCGKAGSLGCDDDNQTQGVVADDVTFVCVPCGPCTAGAGTCAAPLQIPGSGRIQFHGRVEGDDNVVGSCGGAAGPESVFRFTPAVTGCYEFATCGTSFDSQLSLGDGLCGATGPFPQACFDDNQTCAAGGPHEYTFGFFDARQPITVLLDSEGSQGGDYTLDVRPSGACIL